MPIPALLCPSGHMDDSTVVCLPSHTYSCHCHAPSLPRLLIAGDRLGNRSDTNRQLSLYNLSGGEIPVATNDMDATTEACDACRMGEKDKEGQVRVHTCPRTTMVYAEIIYRNS